MPAASRAPGHFLGVYGAHERVPGGASPLASRSIERFLDAVRTRSISSRRRSRALRRTSYFRVPRGRRSPPGSVVVIDATLGGVADTSRLEFSSTKSPSGRSPVRRRRPASDHSTVSPLRRTPLRLRSSSTRSAGLLGHDQGVAARDAGVVEADVGGGAAADPGPASARSRKSSISPSSRGGRGSAAARRASAPGPASRGRGGGGDGEFGGHAPCSCLGSKIESRRYRESPQRGQSGAVLLEQRELGAAARQKNVPAPGIAPASAPRVAVLPAVVEMVPSFPRLVTIVRALCNVRRSSRFSRMWTRFRHRCA